MKQSFRRVRADVTSLPRSGIRVLIHRLEDRPDVIGLHRGEPTGDPPPHVLAAAKRRAEKGARYGPGAGVAELREAIVEKLERINGVENVNPDSIVVSHGAVQGCAVVFDALLESGDRVLLPDVAWPNYALLASLRGAHVDFYRLDSSDGFSPDLDHLADQLRQGARIVVINSPSNPTGWVGDNAVLHRLVELSQQHDFVLVSDEAYDQLVYDGWQRSPAALDRGRVVSLFSFSKTYSMTGWRVGYVLAPDWLAPSVVRIQEGTLGGVSVVTQAGALAALEGAQDTVHEKLAAYRRRRDLVDARLQAAGMTSVTPAGGLFAFLPTGGAPTDAAVEQLINRGVALVPGTVFGSGGVGFLRASLGVDDDDLDKGIATYVVWRRREQHGAA